MKKLVSLIMVLALVLGLATVAFADTASNTEAPVLASTLEGAGDQYMDPYIYTEDLLTKTLEVTVGTVDPVSMNGGVTFIKLPAKAEGYTFTAVTTTKIEVQGSEPVNATFALNQFDWADSVDGKAELVVYRFQMTDVLVIQNNEAVEITVQITAEAPAPGTEFNPVPVDTAKDSVTVAGDETTGKYYVSYTTGENGGTLTLECDDTDVLDWYAEEQYGWYMPDNGVISVDMFPNSTIKVSMLGAPEAEFTLEYSFEAHKKGTEYNPIIVADQAKPYSFDVDLNEDVSPVFVMLNDIEGAILSIEDAHAQIYGYDFNVLEVDDETDDVMTVQLCTDAQQAGQGVVVIMGGATDKKYTVNVSEPKGYDENPEVITDISKIEAEIDAINGDVYAPSYYYSWIATETGKLNLAVSETEWHEDYAEYLTDYEVPAQITVLVNGEEKVAAAELSVEVNKGDVVTIVVEVLKLEERGDRFAIPAYVTVAGSIDPLGSATNPIEISDPADLGGIDVPAKGSVNYAINGKLNGQILTIKVDENATVTLNGKEVKAENGTVTAVLDNTPVNTLTVANKGDKAASYVASINWPVGSESNPIVIESASDLTGLDVPAGESTYVAINSQLNGQILTIAVDENTVVTLNGKEVKAEGGVVTAVLDGTPVNALVVTNKGEKHASYTASIAYELGTAGNPIVITTEKELNGTEIAAGEEVHYLLNSKLEGAVLSVKGDKAYVIVNGEKTEAKDGFIKLTLEAKGATISLVIGNAGDKAATVTLGYSDNPNTGDAGIMAPIAMALVSAMSTVALVIKKKEF